MKILHGKFYFLSFLAQFLYNLFLYWLAFLLRGRRESLSQIVRETTGFFLRIALIQHFLLYPEVGMSYLWQKKFNDNSVEMWVLSVWDIGYYVSFSSKCLPLLGWGVLFYYNVFVSIFILKCLTLLSLRNSKICSRTLYHWKRCKNNSHLFLQKQSQESCSLCFKI